MGNNNKSQLIKGIIFQSEDNIPSSSFSDLNGDGYIKLGNKTYMYIWHDGSHSHYEMQLKISEKYDIINDRCFAISKSNGELDVNDINRVFSGEYSAYKSTMIAKSKKYFRDSFKKEIKMDIKQFNKIKDKAKRTNKSFVASMKDSSIETKIKINGRESRSLAQQICKKYNCQLVVYSYDENKSILNTLVEGNRDNILKTLKELKSNNLLAESPSKWETSLDSKMKDSKVYIFKVKSTYGGDEGQRYINMIKADSIVNAWEKWKEQHSPGWANYLINEVRTDGGDYYPHLFGLPTSVDKKIKSTKWSAGDSIKDVEPKKDESKEEFIARFMNETKSEYPNEKQRYAVANSYWNKAKDSIRDANMYQEEKLHNLLESNWIYKGKKANNQLWQYNGNNNFESAVNRLKSIAKDLISKIDNSKNIIYVKEDITYSDSINDEDITELSQEEMRAIEDYKKAISNTKDVKLLNLYSHILKEEIEHLEELNNAKSEVGDSTCKDKESAKVREYISILEGKIAKKEGYILKPNMILLGDNKTQFPITTQVYQRLIELGY